MWGGHGARANKPAHRFGMVGGAGVGQRQASAVFSRTNGGYFSRLEGSRDLGEVAPSPFGLSRVSKASMRSAEAARNAATATTTLRTYLILLSPCRATALPPPRLARRHRAQCPSGPAASRWRSHRMPQMVSHVSSNHSSSRRRSTKEDPNVLALMRAFPSFGRHDPRKLFSCESIRRSSSLSCMRALLPTKWLRRRGDLRRRMLARAMTQAQAMAATLSSGDGTYVAVR